MHETRHEGSIPESGRSPGEENGNPLQYSCLESSMDRGAWWATIHRLAESYMTEWLSTHHHLGPREQSVIIQQTFVSGKWFSREEAPGTLNPEWGSFLGRKRGDILAPTQVFPPWGIHRVHCVLKTGSLWITYFWLEHGLPYSVVSFCCAAT